MLDFPCPRSSIMPIGLVSDEDFERELNNSAPKQSVPSITIAPLPTRGRKQGDTNVPDSLRKVIGETAVIDGRQAALSLAADFGISPSSVSAYANGATSTTTYDKPVESIIKHMNKSRQRSIKRASGVLNAALSAITQDKLDYTDARDLSAIAKDMSVVIKNLEPPADPTINGD